MKNNHPFEILLDSYSTESFSLFCLIANLLNYPKINNNIENHPDFEGKIYASTFAYLCSEYLEEAIRMYPHEDFELFCEEMNFEEDIDSVEFYSKKNNIEFDIDDLNTAVFDLIKATKKKIENDLENILIPKYSKEDIFSSIENMEVE